MGALSSLRKGAGAWTDRRSRRAAGRSVYGGYRTDVRVGPSPATRGSGRLRDEAHEMQRGRRRPVADVLARPREAPLQRPLRAVRGDVEVDQPDRLLRRAATRAGDARDG